jgi:diguanylate cyclase (GGDEF)-like protein
MNTERRLSELLSDFARTMVTNYPIQSILDHLVVRIVEVLPIDSAGVTLISPQHVARHVAASDSSALRFIGIQEEMGSGPCLTAHATGKAVAVADLANDARFPEFSRRGIEEGLGAVFSFPLRDEGHQVGALDLYRTTAGPLNGEDMLISQTLADVATVYILNAQARVDLEMSAEQAHHRALHDALTGLPNRVLFVQRLDHAILRCRRSAKMLAVLYADLDEFKSVNDSYGHHVGDELLVAVADRLTGMLRPGDTLARLAGDEFAILCEDLDDESQAEPLATRIGDVLSEPFHLAGSELTVTASVGIAFAGVAEDLPEIVLEKADAAMYQAKRTGGGHHAIIDLRDHQINAHLSRLNRDLRGALRRNELLLHYQPIVDTTSGRVQGSEALLRWIHPSFGAISPSTFIPLAEQSGSIGEIGGWVLNQALANLGRWQTDVFEGAAGISANVSVHQLMAPGFARSVAALFEDSDADPALLTLEVTENVLVADEDRALAVLTALKRVGVKLALDDFGSGQSSLNHIKWFPIDVVKIDREFITDIVENHASSLIVDAVVGLSHGLGLKVVAEGVETRAQLKRVADLGCDYSQGYLFARPEPADEMDVLLTSHHILPWSRPMQLSLGPNKEAAAGPSSARGGEGPLLPDLENWRRKQA